MGSLIFQNETCLVINKLPGESSEFPKIDGGGFDKVFPVHRLDTPVTGCLLLAKNKEAAAFLGAAFTLPEAGAKKFSEDQSCAQVKKRYWAIIEKSKAVFSISPEGTLIHWLHEDKKTNKSFAISAAEKHQNGSKKLKKSIMRYKLAGQGDNYLFMEIELVTGRHHQIRAQLAAKGLHVKGDLKYGAKRSEKQGGIRLHAFSLAFPNPLCPDEIIRVKTLPPVMDSLWTAFQKTAGVQAES